MPLAYRFPFSFRPKPDGGFDVSITPDYINIGNAGTAFVASSTVNAPIFIPSRTCVIRDVRITSLNAPAVGSGVITVQLFRYIAATSTAQAITGTFSVKNDNITANQNLTVPITATDGQCVCQPGDTLYFALVAAGTVTTQPTALACIEYGIIS